MFKPISIALIVSFLWLLTASAQVVSYPTGVVAQKKRPVKPNQETSFDRARDGGFDVVFIAHANTKIKGKDNTSAEFFLNLSSGNWRFRRIVDDMILTGSATVKIDGCNVSFYQVELGLKVFGNVDMCGDSNTDDGEPGGHVRIVLPGKKGLNLNLNYEEEDKDEPDAQGEGRP